MNEIAPDIAPEEVGASAFEGREGLPALPEVEAVTAELSANSTAEAPA